MTKQEFLNRLRSLFNIDGWKLPELSKDEQAMFVSSPVRYLMKCDDQQADAIWREVDVRQPETLKKYAIFYLGDGGNWGLYKETDDTEEAARFYSICRCDRMSGHYSDDVRLVCNLEAGKGFR